MSFIGSMLGNGSGSGFQAQGTNADQTSTAYNNTQNAIAQQQAFVNALGQQNGLANQNSVFQQQQALSGQLQGIANGQGPNPAQAQLAQATGQNVANQASLMAGQRGASQNVGLIARQAAQQGANTQQQAAGQGATLQAQQSLGALQQLQNQQASMGNLANTQVSQQQAGLSGLNSNTLQQQGNLLGIQGNQNSTNAGIAGGNQSSQANLTGNLMGGIGSVASSLMAEGGKVKMASGGPAQGAVNGQLTSNPLEQGTTNQTVTQQGLGAGSSGSGTGSSMGQSGPQSNVGKAMNSGIQSGQKLGQQVSNLFKSSPDSATNMTDDQTQEAYLDADSQLGVSGGDNPEAMMSASNNEEEMPGFNGTSTYQPTTGPSELGGDTSEISDLGDSALSDAGDFFGGTSGTGFGEAGQGIGDFLSSMFGSFGDLAGGAGEDLGEGVGNIAAGATSAGTADAAGTAALGLGEEAGTAAAVAAKGGKAGKKVPALVSPGEVRIHKQDVKKIAQGASPMKVGEKIPGKPKVGGAKNSYANDTVPKTLNEGDIILPRSVTQSKNPEWAAHQFVRQLMAKGGVIKK